MSATSDLATIQRKVRLITGRTSTADMTDDEVDFYINTYLLYDFPEQIKNQVLKTNYEFVTQPNIDKYDFPIEEFVLLESPMYCGGYKLNFYQNQSLFYAAWPKPEYNQTVAQGANSTLNENTGTAGAATMSFSGSLVNTPVSPGSVTISLSPAAIVFTDNGDGTLAGGSGGSLINYSTGAFTVNFPALAVNNIVFATYNFVQQLTSLAKVPVERGSVTLCANVNGQEISYVDDSEGNFLSSYSFPITGITQASPAVITSINNSVQVGDLIFISGVFGMTQINGGPYTVTARTVNSVTISLDSSMYSPYVSGGQISVQKGTVNYLTGGINLDFGGTISGSIQASYFPYAAARPLSVLYFGNQLVLRPVPDRCYRVVMQVYQKPKQLLQNSQSPELRQWWQLIAYGAAIKIFADNLDNESIEKTLPLFKEQEILAMRATIGQYAQRKITTPFSDVPAHSFYPYDWNGV